MPPAMTIEELHGNETIRRREFPVVGERIYLAHAAVSPLPARVAGAMADYLHTATGNSQVEAAGPRLKEETRRLAADLLGCPHHSVALLGSTSVALSVVANGLDFGTGANVVFSTDDFPSNVVVWRNLAIRGVEVRGLRPHDPGRVTLDDLRPLVDRRTVLVALSSGHYLSGYVLDLEEIGSWLKSRGVLFSVDAIQTLGALSTLVGAVDFLAADAHKWLLGPCTAGILYVRAEVQDRLRPPLLGWNNVRCRNFLAPEKIEFAEGACRYEAGIDNMVGLIGLRAGLRMFRDLGIEEVERTVAGHTRYLRSVLVGKGYEIAGGGDRRLCGITSFRREGMDMERLYRELSRGGVTASLRKSADGRRWIRFAPHFYATRNELEEALSLL